MKVIFTIIKVCTSYIYFWKVIFRYKINAICPVDVVLMSMMVILTNFFSTFYTYVHKKGSMVYQRYQQKGNIRFLKIDYIVNFYQICPCQNCFGVRIHSKLTQHETKEYEEVKNQKSQIGLVLNDEHLSLQQNLALRGEHYSLA